ncbi:retinoic acid-induced protein 2 [Megalops cyprinoides]|uniref:retinoic acid-induced protein 2 n=1 Tax=Megalops cyprinoides TaxID=118141 RepID=UPI0018646BAA|nr:retinoic acid-induced protein 2 [Megalops cyprinoides]XP_036401259.1 retinoic acid-induced protein 2 [Megalops cyprinoides]
MDDLHKDGQPSLPLDAAGPQNALSSSDGDGSGKLENGMTQLITAEAWNINSSGLMKKALSPMVAVPAPAIVSPATESPGGVALKVAATVLQPICLGDSPVVLPIHLQMAGSTAPQVNQAGGSPYLMTSQGPVSLPLVLEQQVFQHLNSPVLPQGAPCPTISLQNNVLCHNSSMSFSQPSPLDQKPTGQAQEPGVLPLLQNPGFAAILQDMFPSQNNLNASSCHSAAPPPADPFTSTFFPQPPIPHPYGSLLSPLVPPATLLVPYPVIVPLPVPLPVPIPVPIPIPPSSESKGFTDPPRQVCTLSKSTQTNAKEIPPSPPNPYGRDETLHIPQLDSPPSIPVAGGEVLDLSMKAQPIQTKQEIPIQQDSVLDLSVPSVRKPCIQSYLSRDPVGVELEHACRSGDETAGTALSLEVLRPIERAQKLDSKLLNGLASLEFSRQHKWVMDSGGGRSGCEPKCGGGNFEIVSASQTAKVIVSVKDAVPAIFCGKIKGLSGVSTKNFSIKQDANQQAMLQQCLERKAQAEQRDPSDPLKKAPKNRAIKLKKVNSQEIHILPIKKQRLAAFFPRK